MTTQITAKDIRKALQNELWIKSVAVHFYPFVSKMATGPIFKNFNEVTIRIPTEETTRFGRPKPQRRRFDVISLVKPHYKAWGKEVFTIGIEIKVSKSDLLNDLKLLEYVGYTDLFFICVPNELEVHAINKALSNDKIGVIIVGEQGCHVKVMPLKMEVDFKYEAELYKELNLKSL